MSYQPNQEFLSLDKLNYQPLNFGRYVDMQNELTEDDLIEFIFKMRENHKTYVDKLVSSLLDIQSCQIH